MKHLIVFLALGAAMAQPPRPEFFDTGGMPRKPTTFLEQQLFDLIGSHREGDLADAARIQRKLGAYYADKGDEERATAAFLRAAAAEQTAPAPARASARGSGFDGSYFGREGRTMHTWEFSADGSFRHTWMVSGAGTSVRNSERGRYRTSGDTMVLEVRATAGAFTTPGTGGRSTLAGGGTEETTQVRRATFKRTKDQLVLDGVELKHKSW